MALNLVAQAIPFAATQANAVIVRVIVTNTLDGTPVEGATVSFTTTSRYFNIASPSIPTPRAGTVETNVNNEYSAAPPGYNFYRIVRIRVTATRGTETVSQIVTINYFNPELRAPIIYNLAAEENPGLSDAIINSQSIARGILVRVPIINVEDLLFVTVFWGNEYVEIPYENQTNIAFNLLEKFNPLETLVVGTYNVWYTFTDQADNEVGSVPIVVRVQDTPYATASLIAPRLEPASLYNVINKEALNNPITLVVPPQSGPDGSWLIRPYLDIVTLNGTLINTITITVPSPFITFAAGKQITLSNTIFDNYNGVRGIFRYTLQDSNTIYNSATLRTVIDVVAPSNLTDTPE
ncbi:hypothetical protein [Yersinia sp. 2466 StPb PI]|uniref:hypothetical protein n=1 Tax=Yersinia sp. 2466 StPb PI TaxID=3061648 RepID=UPI00355BCD3D